MGEGAGPRAADGGEAVWGGGLQFHRIPVWGGGLSLGDPSPIGSQFKVLPVWGIPVWGGGPSPIGSQFWGVTIWGIPVWGWFQYGGAHSLGGFPVP